MILMRYNVVNRIFVNSDVRNQYLKLFHFILCIYVYTGCSVTGGTSEKGVILHEKISRKYRIKVFYLRLCFRENRL